MKNQMKTTEQEIIKLEEKYKTQNKKNQNLLKMNSNLMKQSQTYLNCLINLKRWSIHKFQLNSQTDENIDIEEAEQFVQNLIKQIEQTIKAKQQLKVNSQFSEVVSKDQINFNCQKCQRWKTLYMKQIQENNRLNIRNAELQNLSQIKNVNFEKLTLDIQNLLSDYLILFKNKWNPTFNLNLQDQVQKKQRKTERSKEKLLNVKQKSISKDNKQKSNNEKRDLQNKKDNDLLKNYSKIANGLRQYSSLYEKQNNILKTQIYQLQQILSNYRQRERNRILYGHE